MDNFLFANYQIDDRSYLSFIKREIHNTLIAASFLPARIGEIDIVVSELTSNIIKHATAGELLYRMGVDDGNKFIEIMTLDNGPEMMTCRE